MFHKKKPVNKQDNTCVRKCDYCGTSTKWKNAVPDVQNKCIVYCTPFCQGQHWNMLRFKILNQDPNEFNWPSTIPWEDTGPHLWTVRDAFRMIGVSPFAWRIELFHDEHRDDLMDTERGMNKIQDEKWNSPPKNEGEHPTISMFQRILDKSRPHRIHHRVSGGIAAQLVQYVSSSPTDNALVDEQKVLSQTIAYAMNLNWPPDLTDIISKYIIPNTLYLIEELNNWNNWREEHSLGEYESMAESHRRPRNLVYSNAYCQDNPHGMVHEYGQCFKNPRDDIVIHTVMLEPKPFMQRVSNWSHSCVNCYCGPCVKSYIV